MPPPAGTYLAKVRNGLIHFPTPIHRYCEAAGWTLFRMEIAADNRIDILPVLADEGTGIPDEYYSSLSADGKLWIPAVLRGLVGLGEQSVMMRIEDNRIGIFLRRVFETLGFGP